MARSGFPSESIITIDFTIFLREPFCLFDCFHRLAEFDEPMPQILGKQNILQLLTIVSHDSLRME